MELERMGFDLTLIAVGVFGNVILVAVGATIASFCRRLAKKWEEDEHAQAC